MLGDQALRLHMWIDTAFVRRLVPVMRRQGARRILYQAGDCADRVMAIFSPAVWLPRNTLARSYIGQHRDNESVTAFLATEANDLQWIGHRAGISSDGLSKGSLQRSARTFNVATFRDYGYRTVTDRAAVHTADFSRYG